VAYTTPKRLQIKLKYFKNNFLQRNIDAVKHKVKVLLKSQNS